MLILILATTLFAAQVKQQNKKEICMNTIDFKFSESWKLTAFKDTPKGKEGCMLLRGNSKKEVVGVIRAKSISKTLAEYKKDAYDVIFGEMVEELSEMDIALKIKGKSKVEIVNPKFADGYLVVFDGTIRSTKTNQTVWVVAFHTRENYYVFTLISPTKQEHLQLWTDNQKDFESILASLTIE